MPLSSYFHRRICLVTLLMTCSATAARAQFVYQAYTVPDTYGFTPVGLNTNGDVGGWYSTNYRSNGQRGYIRANDGTLTTFPLDSACPPSHSCGGGFLTAINDNRQVAGETDDDTIGTQVWFILNPDGSFKTIPPPSPYVGLYIQSLNNAGEVLATLYPSGGGAEVLAVINPAGGYSLLPQLGNGAAPFNGFLNNSGLIAGSVYSNNVTTGYIFNRVSNQYTLLSYSAPSAFGSRYSDSTTVTGINDAGTTIGLTDGPFETEAFIRSPDGSQVTRFFPLDDIQGNAVLNANLSINNAGEIAGGPGSGSMVAFVAVPTSDTIPPSVSLSSTVPGPPEQVIFSVVDPVSGIYSIQTFGLNCNITTSPFVVGQKAPVTVTATKIDASTGAHVGIDAVDTFGNLLSFDPDILTVQANSAKSQPLADVSPDEHVLVVTNGAPGLDHLSIQVNGRTIGVSLKDNESRTMNLGPYMTLDSNAISFIGTGPAGALASVVLQDAGASTISRGRRKTF